MTCNGCMDACIGIGLSWIETVYMPGAFCHTRDVKSQQEGKKKVRIDGHCIAGRGRFLLWSLLFLYLGGLSPSFSPSVRPLNGAGPFQCRCSFFCWTRGCYVRIKHPCPSPVFPIQSSLLLIPLCSLVREEAGVGPVLFWGGDGGDG